MRRFYILSFCCLLCFCARAQNRAVIQYSGLILSADSLTPLPYVHIAVLGSARVITARADGFFSLAVEDGDTLSFSFVGFYNHLHIVDARRDTSSVVVQLVRRSDYLPQVTVYPWGERKNFKDQFMKVKVPTDMIDRGTANFRDAVTHPPALALEGQEAAERNMKTSARRFYYGNMQPQAPNIINPLAWWELYKSIKRGDFKKQGDKKEDTDTGKEPDK